MEDDLARVQDALVIAEEASARLRLKLPPWRLNILHFCWRLGQPKMKRLLFNLKWVRTK